MSETVGVIVRPLDEIAAEIEEQLEGGHNAGRSITRKLACEALAALERAEYASRAPREEPK